ncbi:MAG: FecR domain-containing protein [Cytophagales bacterium]|nr:FecR domain-containing protein [Cytophagales bacterium]
MDNIDKLVKELLRDEYFTKLIIDPDEDCIEFWKQWENGEQGRKEAIRKAREIYIPFSIGSKELLQEEKVDVWNSIEKEIFEENDFGKREEKSKKTKLYLYGIAASISILFLILVLRDFTRHSEIVSPGVTMIEKQSPLGSISSFKFRDGSVVKLFPGSTIRYSEDFGVDTREVHIAGEGFFEVKKDPDHPFMVISDSARTTALGTSFNVRTKMVNGKTTVSLVTGKVKVEPLNGSIQNGEIVELTPGEEVSISSNKLKKQSFDIVSKTAWVDGIIYIESKSLDESLEILKRWFDVQFVVNNGWRSKGFKANGRFKNQSLENIMMVLSDSYQFEYKFLSANKIEINF